VKMWNAPNWNVEIFKLLSKYQEAAALSAFQIAPYSISLALKWNVPMDGV